jgi:hypothetical protein
MFGITRFWHFQCASDRSYRQQVGRSGDCLRMRADVRQLSSMSLNRCDKVPGGMPGSESWKF